MWDYDVAVIGLGPAGATLARLLNKELRVIALDRAGGAAKPCGGLLSSDAQKALAVFDMTLPREVLVDPQIFAVKTIDVPSGLIRHYQRFYINLDRQGFDLWLKGLIPGRVDVRSGALCTGVERREGGFTVSYSQGGEQHKASARYVVGADGAGSIVRRSLFPNSKMRSYLAIQQWFREESAQPFYSCIFDPDTSDCCSWSISKDSRLIFGGAFPLKDARRRFEEQKRKLQRYGFTFGEPLRTEACMVMRPSSPFDFRCAQGGAFLIGEAAGFVSPSSLEGISSAIISARLLSEALNSGGGDPSRAYRRSTLGIRLKLSLKLLKCPFMYCPPLRRLVMRSGLKAISIFRPE